MNDLSLPITFLDIEDLAQRWKCRVSTIEALAETDKLRFCVRPAALEIALAGTPPETYHAMVKKLAELYVDHRYVYLMFKDKERKIEITHIGLYDVQRLLKDPLRVDFFDLVIPMEQIENFELLHGNMAKTDYEFKMLSEDFTCFIWHGKEYNFGEQQAKVIKCLWQARENGHPWMYGKTILKNIDSSMDRIKDIFGHNKYWRRIIVSNNKGKYKLNMPPKQLTLFS
jgi:hypothetical protein